MDARETWQALQARLTAARAAVDTGDRERALAEVTAALDIDPNFLAAHSLRDRILATMDAAPATLKGSPYTAAATPTPTPKGSPSQGANDGRPLAPPDGYTNFEQRAKRRRVDRRLDAARAALASGRLKAAATALDEVIELDPNLPDLTGLTAQFDDLRRTTAAARRGPRLVAGAVFIITVLGASWLRDSTALISRPMIAAVPPAQPATSIATQASTPAGDAGVDQALVKQALQRYQTADEDLHACDVRVHGESATATCQGSARDVEPIVVREPRVEPRTWSFTLRKAGADWTIDSARAER